MAGFENCKGCRDFMTVCTCPKVASDCSQATFVIIDKSVNNPAYWLAIGSAGTAIDLSVMLRIAGGQDAIADELNHLAKNFLRLAELAAES